MQKQYQNASKAAGVAAAAIIGAFLSRWHGGGFISGSPKLLKAFIWSLPFALASGAAIHLSDIPMNFFQWLDERNGESCGYVETCHAAWMLWAFSAGCGLAVLIGCMVFKNTGHGGGMDLAHNTKEPGKGREPEKLEYLILWANAGKTRYWYDFALLAIIGGFSTFPAFLAFSFVDIPAGMVVLAGGLFGKPCGYAIGHALADKGLLEKLPDDLDHATAVGEFLTGLFAYCGLSIATIMVIF